MTSGKVRRRTDLVSEPASYIHLTKGLTPLCLTGSAPSHIPGRTISTPRARLLRMRAVLPPGGVEQARIPIRSRSPTDLKNQPPKGNVMAKSKFRPLHDRVVVKRIDAEEKTKGGIIIPDSAKDCLLYTSPS